MKILVVGGKTKQQLLSELAELRQRISGLEILETSAVGKEELFGKTRGTI